MKKMLFFGQVQRCACGKGYRADISGDIDGKAFDVEGNGETHAEAINTALLSIGMANS